MKKLRNEKYISGKFFLEIYFLTDLGIYKNLKK
jgi:hypothetical protein